jgi:hypothetical protein
MKRDKILIYLDKKGKNFLVYEEKDLLDNKKPVEYVDNGTNSSKNELTLKFKLIVRKTE